MNKLFILLFVITCLVHSNFSAAQNNIVELPYKNVYFKASGSGKDQVPFVVFLIPRNLLPSIHGKFLPSNPYQTNSQIKTIREKYSVQGVEADDLRYAAVTYDSTPIPIIVQGINDSNANDFEYCILENGKVISPWSVADKFNNLSIFRGVYGGKDKLKAYLGSYKVPLNGMLTIQIRKKNIDTVLSSGDIFGLARAPHILASFKGTQLDKFLELKKFFDENQHLQIPVPKKMDSLIKVESKFKSSDNGVIIYFDDNILTDLIEYKIEGEQQADWQLIRNKNYLWLKDLPPGKYKLRLRYTIQPYEISDFDFEILPAWYQAIFIKVLTTVLILLAIGAIFLFLRNIQILKRKNQEKTARERIQTELNTIRSQLNPHFIFNSLTSIQNLINKSKIEEANNYLTDFSALMRNVLEGTGYQFNSLQAELKNLQYYLNLEQLRFPFNCEIKVYPDVNITEIDIPSLLLQPIVENSIKHGIGNTENGRIKIHILKETNNLIVLIADNGKGFKCSENSIGYGLKLTKERISLTNRILNGQEIQLGIQSEPNKGTEVTILFKNWLL